MDRSRIWHVVPRTDEVETYLRDIQVALELDETCLVLALIFLERAMSKGKLFINRCTWRCSVMSALIVASKVVYDDKVFLADYKDQLPCFNLSQISAQEIVFLNAIDFNTTVKRCLYARYYYSLEDVARSFPMQ